MDIVGRRRVGAGLWIVGALVAGLWGLQQGARGGVVGVGFAPGIEVAAVQTARIEGLAVQLHQQVRADQIVAHLDTRALREAAAVASAELLAVQEQVAAEAAGTARRFAEGAQEVQLDAVRLSVQLSDAIAQRDVLYERLSLEVDLADQGAASPQAVEEWRRQIRVLQARIDASRTALRIARAAAEEAHERTAGAPRANPWAVVSQTRALEQIEGQIARMDLAAGIDGQVTWIHRRSGEVVRPGEPVLEVRPTHTQRVVAFVDASRIGGLQSGGPVEVVRASGQVLAGRLVSIGLPPSEAARGQLPASLSGLAGPGGVPIQVQLEHTIGAEERVSIRL